MGLAILGIVIYHAPLVIGNPWLELCHSALNCGVDLFLFFSGLGACHSIAARGGRGYFRQRVKRILPGLYPVLIPWSFLMVFLGLMTWKEFFGSVTLIGWWVGIYNQLNWYFSAVWLFFLLAIPLYDLFRRTRHPILLWLGLSALTLLLEVLIPHGQISMLLSRLLVFLTGMLFGRLEQLGFSHENRLRAVLFPVMLFGLWALIPVTWGLGYVYGYTLGLWWLPYALFIPGGAVLLADSSEWLRRFSPARRVMGWLEQLGRASSEILIVHLAIYKVILGTRTLPNRWWCLVMVACLILGVLYRKLIEFIQNQKTAAG